MTPVPADLVITNVSIPQVNYSGEKMTFTYTVKNEGPNPVWAGTAYWTDFIWLSADPTFNRFAPRSWARRRMPRTSPCSRARATTSRSRPRFRRARAVITTSTSTPTRTTTCRPTSTPTRRVWRLTDWWPADTGDNSYWLGQFNHWAFEDPNNNRIATPFDIIYREPDLTVTNITVPPNVTSGTTIPITYTVTNKGTRATRTDSWTDRVFLSQDPSLDTYDTVLGDSGYGQVLAAGASYTETVNVRIPDGIQGPFDVIVYADSDASTDFSVTEQHRIRPVRREDRHPNELDPYDLVSVAVRSLGRGHVPQYENEGDKLASVAMPVTLAPPPDLQVTAISSDANAGHVYQGQTLDVTYTVTNCGAATPPTMPNWNDLIYFSADANLDLKADRYLGMVKHQNGLGAGASYTDHHPGPGAAGPDLVRTISS